jgi:hypothetical protein
MQNIIIIIQTIVYDKIYKVLYIKDIMNEKG